MVQEIIFKEKVDEINTIINELRDSYLPIDFEKLLSKSKEWRSIKDEKELLIEIIKYFYGEEKVPVCPPRIKQILQLSGLKDETIDKYIHIKNINYKDFDEFLYSFYRALLNYSQETGAFQGNELSVVCQQIRFVFNQLKEKGTTMYLISLFLSVLYINGIVYRGIKKIIPTYPESTISSYILNIIKECLKKQDFYVDNKKVFKKINIELYYKLSLSLRIINICSKEIRITHEDKVNLIEKIKELIEKKNIDKVKIIRLVPAVIIKYLDYKHRLFDENIILDLAEQHFGLRSNPKTLKGLLEGLFPRPEPVDNNHYLEEAIKNLEYFARDKIEESTLKDFINETKELCNKSEYINDPNKFRAFLRDVASVMYFLSKEKDEKLHEFIANNITRIFGSSPKINRKYYDKILAKVRAYEV